MDKFTALYFRLSVDDDNYGDSDSIMGQRELLNHFVKADPILSQSKVVEFSDDGWSGTTFQRPGVEKLLECTRRGEVGCIIVKDLSRWGRNHYEVSEYIEKIFPFLGVRFIAINDDYDSDDFKGATAPMNMAFSSLMHDVYCRELSKKVRQSYIAKAEKGEFICGVAPYGFVKSDTEKNLLIIDEEAAFIVRRIFELACGGDSTTQIATALNAEGVDSPLMYRKRKGRLLRGAHSAVGDVSLWNDKNVRTILRDERYTGMQVSGKTRKPKPGSRKTTCLPESEWIKVPGAHEAIISGDIFLTAQSATTRYSRTGKRGCRALFAGKIKCGVCGHALEYAYRKTRPFYFCGSHSIDKSCNCFSGRLYVDTIKECVFTTMKVEAGKMLDKGKKRRKTALKYSSDKEGALHEIRRLTAQSARLDRQGMSLYEDYVDGSLSREEYLAAKLKCTEELSNVEVRISDFNAMVERMEKDNATSVAASDSELLLKRIVDATDVTDEILSVVDRIVVYDHERIEVNLSFGDSNLL